MSARLHRQKKERDRRLRAKFEKDIAARLRGVPTELARAAKIAWTALLYSKEAERFTKAFGPLPDTPTMVAGLTYSEFVGVRPCLTIYTPKYEVPLTSRVIAALKGTTNDDEQERAFAVDGVKRFMSRAIMAQNIDTPLLHPPHKKMENHWLAITITLKELE